MSKSHKLNKRRRGLPDNVRKPVDLTRPLRQARDALAGGQADLACQLLAPLPAIVASSDGRELLADVLSIQAFGRWDRPMRAIASVDRALEVASTDAQLVRIRGSLLRRAGRLRASLPFLLEAHELAPTDPSIALEAILTEVGLGEPVSQSLASRGKASEEGVAGGILAAANGELAVAEQRLASVDTPVSHLLCAIIRLIKGDANAALPALSQSAFDEILPATARAFASFYCGLAHVRTGTLQQGAEALQKAISPGLSKELVRDHLVSTYNRLVIEAVLEEDLARAADWLALLGNLGGPEAVAANDNLCYVLRLYGQEKARNGDYAEAARHWSRALEIQPRDYVLRQNLAVALERADRGDEAIPHWHELIQQLAKKVGKQGKNNRDGAAPRDDDDLSRHVLALAHRHLADLYLDEDDDTVRAIAQLERALELLDDVDARFELARLFFNDGEYQKAGGHLERVVAQRPDWVDGLYRLGRVRCALSDFDEAVAILERAHALAPQDPKVRAGLGEALAERVVRCPATFSAFDEARRAVALLPEGESAGLIALATAQFARGKRKEALQSLRRCVREARDKTTALIEVGQAYLKAGERKLAVDAWTRAMKKTNGDPGHVVTLSTAWATIQDVERCVECVRWLIEEWGRYAALKAATELAGLPDGKAFLRKVIDVLSVERSDCIYHLFVIDCLLLLKDMVTARERINRMALDAVADDDPIRVRFVIDRDYDYKPRLLERKTALAVAGWIEDHPGALEVMDDD